MLVCCQHETGMWAQIIPSQVSHTTEFIITRTAVWQPRGRSWLSRQFSLRRYSNWKTDRCCVLAVGSQRQNRPGRVYKVSSSTAHTSLQWSGPQTLAGNKCFQARQSYLTIQLACEWLSLGAEPELASFVLEVVLSKRKGVHQHCYSKAKLLEGNSSTSEHSSRALYGSRNLTCRKGHSLTYAPVSMFNWQLEIKVICRSKDREGVRETSSAFR